MNVYLRELKAYRRSAIIWMLSLSTIVVLFMFMYPAFTKDIEASKKALESFPAAVRAAFDLSLINFFNVFGFYSYVLSFVLLAGAIQAKNLGTGIISKEESGKTADFLLTKPVTRNAVVTNKILAALSVLLITNLVFISVSVIAASVVSKEAYSLSVFTLLAMILLFVQLWFLALGILFSVTLPRIKSVIAVSLPTVFAFYIVSTLGAVLGNDKIRYITPFKFFNTDYIISNGRYEPEYIIIEIVFIVMTITASYMVYIKKDVRSAS